MPMFESIRGQLGLDSPQVFLVLGNDDPRCELGAVEAGEALGLWRHAHARKLPFGEYVVYGYACVPPTPFRLKDWERYDVSRHVDPGCVSPEDGVRTVPVPANEVRFGTIERDLQMQVGEDPLDRAIFLFHSPPYRTELDRAALDGQRIDGVPLDVHVGSIAIARFIELRQPLLTLHGHVHESARLTGRWHILMGRTHAFTAAHDGPELALVRFDAADPATASRELL
jgi:Icc-related predicted phosphoesterase